MTSATRLARSIASFDVGECVNHFFTDSTFQQAQHIRSWHRVTVLFRLLFKPVAELLARYVTALEHRPGVAVGVVTVDGTNVVVREAALSFVAVE